MTLFIVFVSISLIKLFILYPSLSLMDELTYQNFFSHTLSKLRHIGFIIITLEVLTAVLILCIRTKLLKKWASSFNFFVLILSLIFVSFVINPQVTLLSHGFEYSNLNRLNQLYYILFLILFFRAFLLVYLLIKSRSKILNN